MGVRLGVDPGVLAEAGWGVVLPQEADPRVRDALAPLLQLRREQAGRAYREFAGSDGYRPGESKHDFLARHGSGPGPADPERVPYYLLLVGDPGAISFEFQSQLSVQYAVGRLAFDSAEGYANYASAAVAAERAGHRKASRAVLFGPSHPGDQLTTLVSQHFLGPLADNLWYYRRYLAVETVLGPAATKARLAELLATDPPALLVAAGHGLGFTDGGGLAASDQGALLCANWPGPGARGPVPDEYYFAGGDVSAGMAAGSVVVLTASYSAGAGREDETVAQLTGVRPAGARLPTVSRLAQHLLGGRGPGALAVVGFVDRVWGYSFPHDEMFAKQRRVFRRILKGLADRLPVGQTLEAHRELYAESASDLSVEMEEITWGKQVDDARLAAFWALARDGRNLILLGDPAVRVGGQVVSVP